MRDAQPAWLLACSPGNTSLGVPPALTARRCGRIPCPASRSGLSAPVDVQCRSHQRTEYPYFARRGALQRESGGPTPRTSQKSESALYDAFLADYEAFAFFL